MTSQQFPAMPQVPFQGMTPAQRSAMITAQMAAMMTPAHQEQMRKMRDDYIKQMQFTHARVPTDDFGKAFSQNAACVIQQPAGRPTALPATLINAQVTVMSTSGERVRVRYLSGEEREFHKGELGVQ